MRPRSCGSPTTMPDWERLADVWEVLANAVSALGLSEEQVRGAALRKRPERGGFEQRLWLVEVIRHEPD